MNDDGQRCSELLQAQTKLYNQTFDFINSASLKCAIQLGIPDVIHNHGKPMTLSELVAALPINQSKAHCIYRLMRLLVHSGLFVQQKVGENEAYFLTPTSRLLLKDEPFNERALVIFELDPILIKPWLYLSDWFQNDDTNAFETAHGRSFWDFCTHRPRLSDSFNEAMASDSQLMISVLIEKFKDVLGGLTSLIDVGGGTGTMARAIAKAFPSLKCTVFDLPHVVADLQGSENLEFVGGDMFETIPPANAILLKVFEGLTTLVDVGGGTGTVARAIAKTFPDLKCTVFDLPHVVADLQGTKNLDFVGGDMFETIPNANAILLKWILHDWSDDECVKILKKCKEAIPSKDAGGKVIIIDMNMENQKEDDESVEAQLFFDMLMMVVLTGKERNEKEWAKLFSAAGYSNYKITPMLGLRSLIEVYP